MQYPCEECIIKPMCSDECVEYLKFINFSADKLPIMTSDELKNFREVVPLETRKKVQAFIAQGRRYVVDFSLDFNGQVIEKKEV